MLTERALNKLYLKRLRHGLDKNILRFIEANKGDGYIKQGVFSTQIIYGGYKYVFPRTLKAEKNKDGLFLFATVRKEAKCWLRKNPKFRLPTRYGTVVYTEKRVRKGTKMAACDLNHAYWRIAYLNGVISKKTYLQGLPARFKAMRLAALSTLGGGKTYRVIENGVITDKTEILQGDEKLRRVYEMIRLQCYAHMHNIRKRLGDAFIAYRTDCIYYYDTPKNRSIVMDYLDAHDLDWKLLTEGAEKK